MNAVEKDVKALVSKELENANRLNPLFHSQHEGFAVIVEELQEATEELREAYRHIDYAWNQIRLNNSCVARQQIVGVEYAAERLATEAIQTAAMCKKFIQSEV